jgi:ADP-heptose:LPS heptosyltransferase
MVKSSLLKNGFFVRRPLSNALLLFLSKILKIKGPPPSIPTSFKKILLCNIANLGDVVISTVVLPVIKEHFPDCEIGFMVSSQSAVVIKDHPLVTRVHRFDHWYLHRFEGLCKAVLHHWITRWRLLRELRQVQYDVAIDLYSYFPNSALVLRKSQIPIRIGYSTGGFVGLFTHPVEWNFEDRYVGYAHLHLLTLLKMDVEGVSPLPYYNYKKETKNYVVVHMGSSQKSKEWNLDEWIKLIRDLEAKGHKVVLTGKGKREKALCKQVASQTSAQDLSDQLSWIEFVTTIQEASQLFSVDSVALHIAAASQTPVIGFFTKKETVRMWSPPYGT